MKAKSVGEFVSRDLVVSGTIEPGAWLVIARVVAAAIEQDRNRMPRDEEDTLP